MSRKLWSRVWPAGPILLVLGLLAGCGGPGTASTTPVGGVVGSDSYTSAYLNSSYEDALLASSQLVLGTLRLEGTENAVTPEQAKTLLPLWQALAGGNLTDETEVNAVLKQIEGSMTKEQLTAIVAMKLTSADMTTWMQEQGMAFRPPDGQGGAYPNPGRTPGAGNGPGGPGNMSEEERAALRATMEAGGFTPPGGNRQFVTRGGQGSFLIRPLIQLLAVRAGVATPLPLPPAPTTPQPTQ